MELARNIKLVFLGGINKLALATMRGTSTWKLGKDITYDVTHHGLPNSSQQAKFERLITTISSPMATISKKTFVFTPDAVPPLATFSQAVVLKGMVYASGNIGCDKEFNIVPGGVQEQTRAALRNLSIILKASGSSLENIVKVNVYLTNMPRDFQSMNIAYSEFFDKDKMPARTCVGVVHLPLGADVEIECVAEVVETS